MAAPPISELETRVAEQPHHPHWAYELALAYHEAHLLDKAISQYRRALELDPTNSLINTSLQTALTERRMLHDAFAQFETGLTLPHNNAAASYNFGLVAEKQGLIEEAYFYYARYVTLAPTASDARSVQTRLSAIDNAILHRSVKITKLSTTPDRIQPGERAAVVFSYRVAGYGRHNSTGVVEQVSLFREETETHRFRQRAIRATDRGYNATIEFLVPVDSAPGVYTLVASVTAGSRRDEQIAVFPIDPRPIDIPDPITAEEFAAIQAAEAEAALESESGVSTTLPTTIPVPGSPAEPARTAPQTPEPSASMPVETVAPPAPTTMPQEESVEIDEPAVSQPASQPSAKSEKPGELPTPAPLSQPASQPSVEALEAPTSAPRSQPASQPAASPSTAAPASAPTVEKTVVAPSSQPTSLPTVEDLPPEESAGEAQPTESRDEAPDSQPAVEPSEGAGDQSSDEAVEESPATANVPD